jgi:hypothetical protein
MCEELCGLNGLALQLQRLRLSREWLRAEALAGRLPCLKIGRRLLFNVQAVEETLARRAAESKAGPERLAQTEVGGLAHVS